ncbi:hypothetical protein LCGC14_0876970 [marine sediment metagenome]|uniref:Terminase small subunit n=1 Tax=marine sediment metagenome TaxID=412755 RepID=A0A0F9P7Y4_9ZZZZ
MTLDELRQEPEYKACTQREQVFLVSYLGNGRNPIEAASVAYDCKDEKSAVSIGRRNLARPPIVAVISKFDGAKPVTISEIWLAIRESMQETGSVRFQATKLAAQMLGVIDKRDGGVDKADITALQELAERENGTDES